MAQKENKIKNKDVLKVVLQQKLPEEHAHTRPQSAQLLQVLGRNNHKTWIFV